MITKQDLGQLQILKWLVMIALGLAVYSLLRQSWLRAGAFALAAAWFFESMTRKFAELRLGELRARLKEISELRIHHPDDRDQADWAHEVAAQALDKDDRIQRGEHRIAEDLKEE